MSKLRMGKKAIIGRIPGKMSELEELHFACFKGRVAYWQKTGIDLPIERFYAVKEDNGDIVVRIRRQNK